MGGEMGWRSLAIMVDRIDSDFKLREWLAALGVSQAKLAEDSGYSEPYISQLVSGEKQNPSTKMVKKLGETLHIRPQLLWEMPPKGLRQGQFDRDGLANLLNAHLRPEGSE